MKLWSRKEVCEDLGITMKTLLKKIKELNIECVNEVLPNNVVSMKIKLEDYLLLAKEYPNKRQNDFKEDNSSSDMVLYGLKAELFKAQIGFENALKNLTEKEEQIKNKDEQLKKLEDKNEQLFIQFCSENEKRIDLLTKINELQHQLLIKEQETKKGLLARLFGK